MNVNDDPSWEKWADVPPPMDPPALMSYEVFVYLTPWAAKVRVTAEDEEDAREQAIRAVQEGHFALRPSKTRALAISHPVDGVPRCPACGSDQGTLGTERAYFTCTPCGADRFWTVDNRHPAFQEPQMSWKEAVMLSPWRRRR